MRDREYSMRRARQTSRTMLGRVGDLLPNLHTSSLGVHGWLAPLFLVRAHFRLVS